MEEKRTVDELMEFTAAPSYSAEKLRDGERECAWGFAWAIDCLEGAFDNAAFDCSSGFDKDGAISNAINEIAERIKDEIMRRMISNYADLIISLIESNLDKYGED